MALPSSAASTAPPTLTVHSVAIAIANQSRLARSGRVILVCCRKRQNSEHNVLNTEILREK